MRPPARRHQSLENVGSSISRWMSSPEQRQILEEIFYNNGVTHPSSSEVSQIAARLRLYGAVSTANVYIWFQNQRRLSRRVAALPISTTATIPSNVVPSNTIVGLRSAFPMVSQPYSGNVSLLSPSYPSYYGNVLPLSPNHVHNTLPLFSGYPSGTLPLFPVHPNDVNRQTRSTSSDATSAPNDGPVDLELRLGSSRTSPHP